MAAGQGTAPLDPTPLIDSMVQARLAPAGRDWLARALAEQAGDVDDARFGQLLSAASRIARRQPLQPSPALRMTFRAAADGLDPERWTLLEAVRVRLILAHPQRANDRGQAALESAFQYADEGELCALYRSLALLPEPKRFAWRAGEGCRSNMRSVFEAVACDTPYPWRWFDPIAWRQCVMKALFIGAPVARIQGLAARRDEELARMALDLADERRSAGRPVPADLWNVVGPCGGARADASIAGELDAANAIAAANPDGPRAAAALQQERRRAGAAGAR